MSIKNCTGFDSAKAGLSATRSRNFQQTKQASCYLYSCFHKTSALFQRYLERGVSSWCNIPFLRGPAKRVR